MKNVTIHRCPVCDTIKDHTNQLVAELKKDQNLNVTVIDGSKGEFSIDVDGRRIDGKSGDSARTTSELASEIRGAGAAAR